MLLERTVTLPINITAKLMKLILTKGLPASGKTTWAKEYIQQHPETANLCKDDLRLQLSDTRKREKQIIKVRNLLTGHYFEQGCSVIWSDTNLNPIHVNQATEFAKQYQAELIIQDFTHVSLAECIRRDLLRANSVGQQVIEQMYYQYLYQPDTPPDIDPKLRSCYLVDIDGTLASMGDRKPFDWNRVGEDTLNESVARVVDELARSAEIIVLSGRSSVCYDLTISWLIQHDVPFKALFMRADGDMRPDEIIKQELYYAHIRDRYNVSGIIDDRPKVCRMWRSLGLNVFQVGNPHHEF